MRIQRSAQNRLASVMRRYDGVSELLFIRGCLGEEAAADLERLSTELAPALDSADEALQEASHGIGQAEGLQDLGRHFTIRPTFSKGPGDWQPGSNGTT